MSTGIFTEKKIKIFQKLELKSLFQIILPPSLVTITNYLHIKAHSVYEGWKIL